MTSRKGRSFRHLILESARQSPNVTDLEFRVLSSLLSFADGDGSNCFPRLKLVGERCARDRRSVVRALRNLKSKGWVRGQRFVAESGRETSQLYRFTIPDDELHGPSSGGTKCDNMDPGRRPWEESSDS